MLNLFLMECHWFYIPFILIYFRNIFKSIFFTISRRSCLSIYVYKNNNITTNICSRDKMEYVFTSCSDTRSWLVYLTNLILPPTPSGPGQKGTCVSRRTSPAVGVCGLRKLYWRSSSYTSVSRNPHILRRHISELKQGVSS